MDYTSIKAKTEAVCEWKASGLSAPVFAAKIGVTCSQINNWNHRYGRTAADKVDPTPPQKSGYWVQVNVSLSADEHVYCMRAAADWSERLSRRVGLEEIVSFCVASCMKDEKPKKRKSK